MYEYLITYVSMLNGERKAERCKDFKEAEIVAKAAVLDRNNSEVEIYQFFESVELLPSFIKRGK